MAGACLLRRDERGAALMEFGLIAPVLLILIMGAFDAGHRLYSRAVLQGAVQRAARDTGLEGAFTAAQQTAIDDRVRAQLREIHNTATVTITRSAYRSFTAAARRGEEWKDTNANGRCDAGEPYVNVKNVGVYDMDIGVAGQGGAQDAVVYTVRMQYDSVTPVHGVFGLPKAVDFSASTVLRNQPYNDQGSDAALPGGNCS